jgi:hypothetical protein
MDLRSSGGENGGNFYAELLLATFAAANKIFHCHK